MLRIEGCGCHIHLMWDRIYDFKLMREDVGHGVAESVVYLQDKNGQPMVRLFYPEKAYADIEALLV